MSSNNGRKKLNLNRETMRKLNMGQLGAVAGGAFRTSGGAACGADAWCSSRDGLAPTQCPTINCSLHCDTMDTYCQ